MARVYSHSRGIPRLINTVCENALITAYARQARCVTPDIIDEVAADFRLGAVPRARIEQAENNEVRQAVKTLLQVHDQLQAMRRNEKGSQTAVVLGAGKA